MFIFSNSIINTIIISNNIDIISIKITSITITIGKDASLIIIIIIISLLYISFRTVISIGSLY